MCVHVCECVHVYVCTCVCVCVCVCVGGCGCMCGCVWVCGCVGVGGSSVHMGPPCVHFRQVAACVTEVQQYSVCNTSYNMCGQCMEAAQLL